MGDLEKRVLRLETTVKLMQTQLEAINKNIFGKDRNIHVQPSGIVPSEDVADYSNEPSPTDDSCGGRGGGQGCNESVEEILGDIDHFGEAPDLKPFQNLHHFNLKPCQVVLTRIPADQLIKYESIPPSSNLAPPSDQMPCSSKKRVILSKEDYSKAKSYNAKSSDLPLLCGYCPQSIKYTSNTQILAHLSSEHSNNSAQIHKCKFCLRCYKSLEELTAHVDSEEVEGLYSCPDCSYRNSRLSLLILHWSKVHDQSTELVCAYCSRVTYNSKELWNHFRNKHPDGVRFKRKYYKCPLPQCGLTLTAKKSINRHIALKHPDHLHLQLLSKPVLKQSPIKPKIPKKRSSKRETRGSFMCHICSKVFPFEHYLGTHLKTHSEDRPRLICEKCGASYLNKQDLTTHIREKHDGTLSRGDKLCPICGVNTKWSSFSTHMRQHRKRSHCCPFCPAKFTIASLLRIHRSTHTGELAVDCSICGKTCSNKERLKVHMTLHKDSWDFICKAEGCSRKFKNTAQMNDHFRLRHKKKVVQVEGD